MVLNIITTSEQELHHQKCLVCKTSEMILNVYFNNQILLNPVNEDLHSLGNRLQISICHHLYNDCHRFTSHQPNQTTQFPRTPG